MQQRESRHKTAPLAVTKGYEMTLFRADTLGPRHHLHQFRNPTDPLQLESFRDCNDDEATDNYDQNNNRNFANAVFDSGLEKW